MIKLNLPNASLALSTVLMGYTMSYSMEKDTSHNKTASNSSQQNVLILHDETCSTAKQQKRKNAFQDKKKSKKQCHESPDRAVYYLSPSQNSAMASEIAKLISELPNIYTDNATQASMAQALENGDINAIFEILRECSFFRQRGNYVIHVTLKALIKNKCFTVNELLIEMVKQDNYAGVEYALSSGADPNIYYDGHPLILFAATKQQSLRTSRIIRQLIQAGAVVNDVILNRVPARRTVVKAYLREAFENGNGNASLRVSRAVGLITSETKSTESEEHHTEKPVTIGDPAAIDDIDWRWLDEVSNGSESTTNNSEDSLQNDAVAEANGVNDPTLTSNNGRSTEEIVHYRHPLFSAIVAGDKNRVKNILRNSTFAIDDINMIDSRGRTPLHRAAIAGHAEIVNVLLENGAITNLYDNNGFTPYDYARSWGHVHILSLLPTPAPSQGN